MRQKGIIFFIIITICISFSCKKDKESNGPDPVKPDEKVDIEKSEIVSPDEAKKNNTIALQRLMPAYQTFSVDTEKKNTLHSRKGTHLEVPARSFTGPGGKPVTGTVKVSIVEAMNSVDIMAADIPMIYNDGKDTYHFESAGMFRIAARSGNTWLKLAAGKKITVHFPNIKKGDRFNVYRIDGRGRWIYHGHNQETTKGGANFRKYKVDFLTWWNFDHPVKEVACLKGVINGIPGGELKNLMIRLIGIDKLQVDKGIISGRSFSINALKESYVKITVFNNGRLAYTSNVIQVGRLTGTKDGKAGTCQDAGIITLTSEPVEIKNPGIFKRKVGVTEPLYKEYVEAFKVQQDEAEERRRERNTPINIPTL